jgi:hypothetical protein
VALPATTKEAPIVLVRPKETVSVADPDGGNRLVFEEHVPVDVPADVVKKLRKQFPWLLEAGEVKDDPSPVQQATAAPGEKRTSSR